MAIFTLNACSLSDVFEEEPLSTASTPVVSEQESVLAVEEQKVVPEASPDEYFSEEKKEVVPPLEESIAEVKPEEPRLEDFKKEELQTEGQTMALGTEEKYQVQKGETLMMIAFKIYGDYRKWKDLKEWNQGQLVSKIGPGTVLKYYTPEQTFAWQPSGLPHMVKTGDNLGTISMEKYGTSKKWKNIYENNRPLIRDPNLIFAGFTIYYIPLRDIASENR